MMFTWRKQFENDEKAFLDSKYYSTIQDLIKDTRLSDLLEKEFQQNRIKNLKEQEERKKREEAQDIKKKGEEKRYGKH